MDPKAANPDDLRDIQGFLSVQIPQWLWAFLGLVLLGFTAWLIYKYFLRPKPKVPLSIFDRTVESLKKLDLFSESKNFYLEYSEITRLYLEQRLGIALLDKTADEIKPILVSEQRINTAGAMNLSQIFTRADLAKFALQELPLEQKTGDIDQTISILKSIEEFVSFEEQKQLEAEVNNKELAK